MTATSERRIRATDTAAAAAAAGRVVVSQREPAAPHVSRECKRSTVATRRKTMRRVLRWTWAARRVPTQTPAALCTSSTKREPAVPHVSGPDRKRATATAPEAVRMVLGQTRQVMTAETLAAICTSSSQREPAAPHASGPDRKRATATAPEAVRMVLGQTRQVMI